MNAGPAHWPLEEPRRQSGVRPKNKTPPINDDDASVQENRQGAASERPRGATVARLTPDQKVACSNHVGVTELFFGGISFSSEISFSGGKKKASCYYMEKYGNLSVSVIFFP